MIELQTLTLTACDRYFTLYEAQTGVITESELLKTVKSIDREDGATKVTVKNYASSMLTSVTSSGQVNITYITTDSRNNTTEKQTKVNIVDTEANKEGPMDFDGIKKYARLLALSITYKIMQMAVWKLPQSGKVKQIIKVH